MNKDGCHNKQCGMFTEMNPSGSNCAFVWGIGPKTDCDKYQTSEAVVPLNDLLNAIAKYLANDGSNGVFDAMKLADAMAKLEGLVDPKEIAKRQHRPF